MARDTQRRSFSVFRSDAIDENERILEAGRQQRQENREKKEKEAEVANVVSAPSSETPEEEKSTASTTTTPVVETTTTTSTKSDAETPTTTATTTTSSDEISTVTPTIDNQPATTSFNNDIAMNMRKPRGKKTENGITIYVPMEYYERIALMKMRTGVPIKDLALQAVIEFLDRNKM